MLVLDAGNALFRSPGPTDAAGRARADVVARAMGGLGTAAMAPGVRDLVDGIEGLKRRTEAGKLAVLSANLLGAEGKPAFPASKVVEVAGVRVGLIGATAPEPVPGGGSVLPVVPAVLAEAKRLLGKADLRVVLGAISHADALQLAAESSGAIDLVLQAHESRGPGAAQRSGSTFVVPAGERGRQLGSLTVALGGKGPLVDLGEAERGKQLLEALTRQIAQVKDRIKATSDAATRAALRKTLASFEDVRKQRSREAAVPRGARTFKLEWLNLGTEVVDDPLLKVEVEKIEPPGTPH